MCLRCYASINAEAWNWSFLLGRGAEPADYVKFASPSTVKLLDRYVLRNFLQAYIYCIAGFISVWLIFDISDNISTFIDEHLGFTRAAHYYFSQLPQILVILLPVSLLLALLFSLGRMSRANEIVSMLTAGVSVPRVLLPLILVGLLTVAASAALNYGLAPHADLARKTFLSSEKKSRRESLIEGQIFRNRTDARTWFIQNFRRGQNSFSNIQVLQQDDNDNIATSYLANRAFFQPETKTWELQSVRIVHYDGKGNILKEEFQPSLTINHWSETPFRLSSANVRAEYLSVPELRQYLHFNADFPATLLAPFKTHLQYRLALPWTCLVVVFIAAPLGIGFSRRGILSSVATSIILVFSMNFLTHLFLALGEGYRVASWTAAWAPNVFFAVIGLYLLYLRATNREGLGFPTLFSRRRSV
jgi:lipopolysaccharide export system permease protein